MALFSTFGFSQAAAPSGSTIVSNLESSSSWTTCGNCGNSGGSGATATYSMQRGISSPTINGSSTEFKIGGSHPFKNAYWYIKHYSGTPSTPVKYLRYDFYVYVPSSYASAPQAIEFECQQKAGGRIYNFAWQADYAHHSWRVYSPSSNSWQSSGIGFGGFSTNKWHHIVAVFHASSSQAHHDTLTVDGVTHYANLTHSSVKGSSGHYLTNAFQLDLNGNPTPYHVYVDKMSVTYK